MIGKEPGRTHAQDVCPHPPEKRIVWDEPTLFEGRDDLDDYGDDSGHMAYCGRCGAELT